METAIQLRNVSRTYRLGRADVPALRRVNTRFDRGEFTAVAGPSGSGKTTLLNILGCIDKPNEGQIFVRGEDVTPQPLHRLAHLRNQYFGYVFQTFNLISVLTAYENVEFPLLIAGRPRSERRARVGALLEAVGLANHARHKPSELSGGQRQRVAIARALVTNPLAVLADEPTANVDSKTGRELIDLMARLNDSEGVTFIFSTHDPQIIDRAHRVLWMADGVLEEKTAAARLAVAGD